MREDVPNNKNHIDRRKALRKIGLGAAGIVVAGVAGYSINKLTEHDSRMMAENKKHEKFGEAEIVKIDKLGGDLDITVEPNLNPDPNSPIRMGGGTRIEKTPEEFRIILRIKNKESAIIVTRVEANSYKIGQKIKVKYDDRSNNILSLETN